MIKKISKKLFFVLILIIFGGLGGVIADRYLFPYLSTTNLFSQNDFLRKGIEDITIINKTEEITVKEETSINKITNQASSSVVGVISYAEEENKSISGKKEALVSVSTHTFKRGTGIAITTDGLIMTHVSAINPEKSKYKVITHDRNILEAELAGIDSYSGLVFLKIQASNLAVASFENSDDVKAGDKIVAIANNPDYSLDQYASGLISGFNPTFNLSGSALSSADKLEGVYETDLDYRSQFIGGPIVDYSGQIVGIAGKTETADEVNFFVIPANKVMAVIDRMLKKELDKTPFFGAYYIPITKTYASKNGMGMESGALVYSSSGQQGLAIISGSPAEKAGLKIGDIVISVGNSKIDMNHSFSDLLYANNKGERVELTVIRDNQEKKILVDF